MAGEPVTGHRDRGRGARPGARARRGVGPAPAPPPGARRGAGTLRATTSAPWSSLERSLAAAEAREARHELALTRRVLGRVAESAEPGTGRDLLDRADRGPGRPGHRVDARTPPGLSPRSVARGASGDAGVPRNVPTVFSGRVKPDRVTGPGGGRRDPIGPARGGATASPRLRPEYPGSPAAPRVRPGEEPRSRARGSGHVGPMGNRRSATPDGQGTFRRRSRDRAGPRTLGREPATCRSSIPLASGLSSEASGPSGSWRDCDERPAGGGVRAETGERHEAIQA